MGLMDKPSGLRFGLYVFVFLILFCVAQLTWWIIYQLDLNRQIHQDRIEMLHLKAAAIAAQVNADLLRLADKADYTWDKYRSDEAELKRRFNQMLSDEGITGYRLIIGNGQDTLREGKETSALYYSFGPGHLIYFDPLYPQHLVQGELDYIVPARSGDGKAPWVDSGMFKIKPEVQRRIEDESHRGLKMFIFEGSFFMIIVLAGAYLIYRTLQKSEDLKTRQINFTQAVTHEFRTPLTSLRLYLETLESGKLESDQARRLYGKMLDDCDRLESMVDNVLEASHFGKEKYELKLSETNLSEDIKEYLAGLEAYVRRQNGKINSEIENGITVNTDYHALGRVVRAVIDNALKYSPQDSREIKVLLKKRDRNAFIEISDRGVGIPAEEREKVFDRFYRVTDKNRKSVKGTGLGLYLVRQIVEAHGGSVSIEPGKTGHGTTVVIRLPVVKP